MTDDARDDSDAGHAGSRPRAAPRNPIAANATVIYDGAPIAGAAPNLSSGTVFYRDPAAAGSDWDVSAQARSDAAPTGAGKGKIALDDLLQANDSVRMAAANPFMTAAAPILMLLGRLRQSTVDFETNQLAAYVADAIREFERRLAAADVLPADTRIAKYALCETADDILQNLAGADRKAWQAKSMLTQFFQTSVSGVGFFEALNQTLANPEAHHDLLEMMHACLSLGFEGQYRGAAPDQRANLERVRQDVYETLRYFQPRPSEDLSPRWQGLSAEMADHRRRLPLWAIAASMIAVVAGAFFAMRSSITDEGDALAERLLALRSATPIAIERVDFKPAEPKVEVVEPKTSQLDRIRAALATDIQGGNLTIEPKGEFIVVEINNTLLFASGRAEIKPEFEPIAARIATVLDKEPGGIKIVGHTDNVKPRKSSAFKSNYDLSIARAKAVETVFAPSIGDRSRIAVDGKGEDEPIADNATPEGRARNRRVDVMVPREEAL